LESYSAKELRTLADRQYIPKKQRAPIVCPFSAPANCWKDSGVCTLRLYSRSESGAGVPADSLRTTCPTRFQEDGIIFRWVGETILGCERPIVIGQVAFLDPADSDNESRSEREVGRIDNVLLVPNSDPLSWCALEIQSVYFQGEAMKNEFALLRNHEGNHLPFPAKSHRPDYRSSGPKRLMPQLQTKVPSLRRWGKKMAVLVDRSFFAAMGRMRPVKHISNSDVVWFIVGYEQTASGRFRLVPEDVYLTTLEDSVEGLTAGIPASLEIFEQRILDKLQRSPRPSKIATNQQLID
jgi:Restriction endonuclease NotI